MPDLTQTIRSFLERFRLEPAHLLVALSGGRDSTALLVALVELRAAGLAVSAAHVNHHLRGEESKEDEEFVRLLCVQHAIPLVVEQGPLDPALVRARGVEAAARSLRYEILGRIRESSGADYLVTAHHQNDQAETFLMRALSGSATALRGVLPVTATTIRPLLYTPRREIREWVAEKGIASRQDSSNDDPRFLRNRVRTELIPVTESLNPQAVRALARSADQVRELLEAIEPVAELASSMWIERGTNSSRFALDRLPPGPWIARANFLSEVMRLDPTSRDLDDASLRRLFDDLPTLKRVSVTRNLTLTSDGLAARLERVSATESWSSIPIEPDSTVEIPQISAEIELRRLDAKPFPISSKQPGAEFFQVRDLFHSPTFTLRPRRQGERFQPLGFSHEKKLKSVLIDRKIPRAYRDTIPLLTTGDEVIWVDGVGVSEPFRVGDDPGHWFRIAVRYRGDR